MSDNRKHTYRLRALIIDLEYTRDEINEPINIDTIMDSFDEYVNQHIVFDIWYKSLGDISPRDPDNYDLILVSTKVSSGPVLTDILNTFQGKTLIVGGMIATFAHEELLREHKDIIISLGECECNLNQIMHYCILNNDSRFIKEMLRTDGVSGVAFVERNGNLYSSPIVPFDLQTIHKPLHHRTLTQVLELNGLVRIEGSRGCPWNRCSFCSVAWRYGNGSWRAFPTQRILDEILFLAHAGAKCLYFTDEDFVGNSEHFFSLFGEIKKLKENGTLDKDIRFWGSTSVYTLKRFGEQLFEKFLELSAECGIRLLFLGIESGCDMQLKRYAKGVAKADNLSILHRLAHAGIQVDAGFIMFDAKTTLNEISENLQFCMESGLDRTVSRLAKPLRVIPHTKLHHEYAREQLLSSPLDTSELIYTYHFQDPKIQRLFESLQLIDSVILDKANQIQASIRMKDQYSDNNSVEQLVIYRNYEYEFINEFIQRFLHQDIDDAILEGMIARYINKL